MKYIKDNPNNVPKATGKSSNGMVFQLRIQRNNITSTRIKDPAIVVVRSPLIVDEL